MITSSFVYNIFEYNGDFDRIYVSVVPILLDLEKATTKIKEIKTKSQVIISFPFVSRGNAILKFIENFKVLSEIADGFLLENIGDYQILLDLFEKYGLNRQDYLLCGDYSLNVTNCESASYWVGKLDTVAILPEVPAEQLNKLCRDFPKNITPEIISRGEIIVMRSEHCFAVKGENFHCGNCGKYGLSAPEIKDENGKCYKLICNPLDCNCIMTAKFSDINEIEIDKAIIRR